MRYCAYLAVRRHKVAPAVAKVEIRKLQKREFKKIWKNQKISRDVYGVRTAPRSGFSFFLISRSGYPPLQISRSSTERLSPLNMSRSGADFFECVTERISACGESHGFSRSEWISAATDVTDYCREGIRRTFFFTERFVSFRRANRTKSRHFPTVHRGNHPLM